MGRIKSVFQTGQHIQVFGWKASNHNAFTLSLKDKKFVFFDEEVPLSLGEKTGLVLFTRFCSHANFERMKNQSYERVFPFVLGIGQIKKILNNCREVFCPPQSLVSAEQNIEVVAKEEKDQNKPEDFCCNEKEESMEVNSNLSAFTRLFLDSCGSGGSVSSKEVGELLRKCGIKIRPWALARQGWMSPSRIEGQQRTSFYKPGPKMSGISQTSSDPANILSVPVQTQKGDLIDFDTQLANVRELFQEEKRLEEKIFELKAQLEILEYRQKLILDTKELLGKIDKEVKLSK